MRNDNSGCIAMLVATATILAISLVVGAICWPYTINHWLVFFGKTSTISAWQGALLGIIPGFGQLSVPAAVITWVLMLLLV